MFLSLVILLISYLKLLFEYLEAFSFPNSVLLEPLRNPHSSVCYRFTLDRVSIGLKVSEQNNSLIKPNSELREHFL